MNENNDFNLDELNLGDQGVNEFLLDDLLALITPESLHEEIDFGSPVGRELL
jgi:antitoxin component of MazEF toxin-antitoxin module